MSAYQDAGVRFLDALAAVETALGRSAATVRPALADLRRALGAVRSASSTG